MRPRHMRYRSFARLRHSVKTLAFIFGLASKEGRTPQQVFDDLSDPRTPYHGPTGPANTVLPAITGTARVGQTLTVSNGTWTGSPAPTFTRQWKRGGTNIAGATGATYVLVTADAGAVITCAVTATNTGGSATATSAGTAAVTQTPANTVLPVISGTAQVGQTLTTTNGTWTGTPAPTFTRQWKAAGVDIAGATATTYVPVSGDVGKVITCAVTGTNTAGNAVATSAATAAVIA
jgi:hypothetical protein